MTNPFEIALVVVAVFSAIYVALTGGMKLTFGYRESEVTAKRKKRIDKNLQNEAKKEIRKLLAE